MPRKPYNHRLFILCCIHEQASVDLSLTRTLIWRFTEARTHSSPYSALLGASDFNAVLCLPLQSSESGGVPRLDPPPPPQHARDGIRDRQRRLPAPRRKASVTSEASFSASGWRRSAPLLCRTRYNKGISGVPQPPQVPAAVWLVGPLLGPGGGDPRHLAATAKAAPGRSTAQVRPR